MSHKSLEVQFKGEEGPEEVDRGEGCRMGQEAKVSLAEDQWLTLKPRDVSTAIELGYFAGNMHWRVKFDNETLKIALESPEEIYLERLKDFFTQQKIARVQND